MGRLTVGGSLHAEVLGCSKGESTETVNAGAGCCTNWEQGITRQSQPQYANLVLTPADHPRRCNTWRTLQSSSSSSWRLSWCQPRRLAVAHPPCKALV